MRKPKLVMVGNGMAGVRTLEELRKIAPDLYDITVFGAEPHPNYNRILLSPVLAGEMTIQDIILNDRQWYADNGITLHLGARVDKIDRHARSVCATTANGETITATYDRLLLATGSTPFVLPVPGNDLPGVISYRDIKDTDAMIDAAARYTHAVVIGAGLLGLEAANGLALRGMTVTVVHISDCIMERQLDRKASQLLQAALEAKGMRFKLSAHTAELVQGESGRVCAVRFKDGSSLPADLVCMAAGIRPNVALAEKSGIHCNRGIVVDDTLQTFDPRVYAVGECANHRGTAYGLVAPLFEQARVCANHLAGMGIGRYLGSVTSTKLKVTGIDVFSAGDFSGAAGTEEIVLQDPGRGIYKRIVLKDDKLIGAVLYGDTQDGAWYFQLLREARNIGHIRDHLMFGPPPQEGLAQPDNSPPATDVAPAEAGDSHLCGCTPLSHGAVRQAIKAHKLLSVSEVQRHLHWNTPNGCDSCRPALHDYCLATWPHEAIDDPQHRLISGEAGLETPHAWAPRLDAVALPSSPHLSPQLETLLHGMQGPAQIALRVSAALPRGSAADRGEVMESGYTVSIAGVQDGSADAAGFVCAADDDEAVLEYVGAFVQLYREEGFYLETIRHFLGRVGLEHIRQSLQADAEQRRALYEKRLFALQTYTAPITATQDRACATHAPPHSDSRRRPMQR